MRKPVFIIERGSDPGLCWGWEVGIGTRKRNWAIHLSLGLPVWWLPSASRKRHASGTTEIRCGWLLIAIQIAWKAQIARGRR